MILYILLIHVNGSGSLLPPLKKWNFFVAIQMVVLQHIVTLGPDNPGGEDKRMIGIEGKWVGLAYLLSIGSAVLCVVYGLLNWNKGDEPVKPEDQQWAKEEKEKVEDAV